MKIQSFIRSADADKRSSNSTINPGHRLPVFSTPSLADVPQSMSLYLIITVIMSACRSFLITSRGLAKKSVEKDVEDQAAKRNPPLVTSDPSGVSIAGDTSCSLLYASKTIARPRRFADSGYLR